MPWLNWSLKLHIRLRTISLLISTHNTSLCSMNAIFICVIVLVKMCFHMLNLYWFKHKFFFSVLGVFGKYFVFTKTEKFQKQSCPVLATQSQVIHVACYNRELACWFWRLVRKWMVQSRGVHRDFHSSARDSLAGRPSSCEKHLESFFNFVFECFGGLP